MFDQLRCNFTKKPTILLLIGHKLAIAAFHLIYFATYGVYLGKAQQTEFVVTLVKGLPVV